MRKKIILILIISSALNINFLRGQNSILNLNNLPTTIEVRAPEFNTEIKYFFKIDMFQNNLIIQDLRKSKNGKIHFYQWMYEIPLNHLNSESFQISKDIDNNNVISISIKANSSNSIMSYMFQDGKVSSIIAVGSISLGKWTYSDSLYNELVKTISSISASFPKQVSSSKGNNSGQSKFKYIAENVTSVNATMDDDLSIGKGYYFEQTSVKLNSKIVKYIKSTLKQQNINYIYPLPIIVYASREGIIESIFIGNEPYDKYCQIELNKLNSKRKENLKNPTKFLFLLE